MDIIDVIRDDIQSGHDGINQDLTLALQTFSIRYLLSYMA